MKSKTATFRPLDPAWYGLLAACGTVLFVPGPGAVLAQQASSAGAAQETAALLPAAQLDSLVAPIALFPDALLAQTLVASTYPLEIIQLQQWLAKNPGLKDKALTDAVAKQPWDPSVQSMAAIPDVVKRLADDIQWTTELGNAFLAQQGDVMDAVQRMRTRAMDKGALASNEQQKVATETTGDKTVIIVESANPEVVYVPSYSPTVVYGAPVYPYPPIYYPYYPPGAAFVSFTFGVMVGAAWGGYCCGMGWGHNDIDINVDNNFNRNNVNRGQGSGGKWQHDPQHRGGAPYSDRATANKYGGTARGDSLSNRQASARQQAGGSGSFAGNTGTGGRSTGDTGARAGSPSTMDRGAGGAGDNRSSGAQPSGRDAGGSSRPNSGFSGGSGGYSGGSARSSSARGASSMGGRSGGGRRR
jgi:Protein of unknown function (DUF3300)